jgi:hypothetical protein
MDRVTGLGVMCYGPVVRSSLKPDDIPVLAAWLVWEMFLDEEQGEQTAAARGGSGRRPSEPPPPPTKR